MKQRQTKSTPGGRRVRQVLHWVLLGLVGAVLGLYVYQWNASRLAGNRLPMPFGYGFSVVLSGSMEPEISVDDMIVVRPADAYAVGDVVVYQSQGSLVVHRIVGMDGDTVTTKGDANNVADAPIDRSQIKGRVVAQIPHLGKAVKALRSPVGFILVLALAVWLLTLSGRSQRKQARADLDAIQAEITRLQAAISQEPPGGVSVPATDVPLQKNAEGIPEQAPAPELGEDGAVSAPGACRRQIREQEEEG